MNTVSRDSLNGPAAGTYEAFDPDQGWPKRDCKVELTSYATEELERLCSPGDECFVLDELECRLPSAHRVPRLAWLFDRFGLACQYIARVEMIGIEVRYLDINNGRFLVIDAWDAAKPTSRLWSCVLRSKPIDMPVPARQH